MDDVSDIQALYDGDPDREDCRLERHQLERDLSWRYLELYLPGRGRILEVGAGTGRYTVGLARRGYEVLAVDLSAELIARARRLLADEGLADRVEFRVGDARHLSDITDGAFDAVLLMGPLYHLVLKDDRLLAVRQAYDRLVPGGVLFSALISRFGIMGDLLRNVPQWIEDPVEVRCVIERGRDPLGYPKGGFRGYFATVSEIAPLHEEAGFRTEVVAGVEPAISADDESYNQLEGQRRELWLDLLYELSREPSLVASSRHVLYIGRRPSRNG